jgi:hypothetical protein
MVISKQLEYYRRNKEKVRLKNQAWKRANVDKLRDYNSKNKAKRSIYFKKLYQSKLKSTPIKQKNKVVKKYARHIIDFS